MNTPCFPPLPSSVRPPARGWLARDFLPAYRYVGARHPKSPPIENPGCSLEFARAAAPSQDAQGHLQLHDWWTRGAGLSCGDRDWFSGLGGGTTRLRGVALEGACPRLDRLVAGAVVSPTREAGPHPGAGPSCHPLTRLVLRPWRWGLRREGACSGKKGLDRFVVGVIGSPARGGGATSRGVVLKGRGVP